MTSCCGDGSEKEAKSTDTEKAVQAKESIRQ